MLKLESYILEQSKETILEFSKGTIKNIKQIIVIIIIIIIIIVIIIIINSTSKWLI